ncbi:ATP synthase F1 subunit epsilon [Acidicapsa dinghuensis]|uniref:ATP synthase epsilon chain n=1 Tax=Acidicapsa dinghuensis TaxID=2218256 RepID=A0ABW1EFZ6_9BACT|nr:ATP synthase F1 subunit epsilon [Acidicapsa dinghuensis]
MADSTNQLRVRLVTPERVIVDLKADAVELPAKTGYMEVLYGHAPLLAELGAGDVTLHGATGGENAGNSDRYNVSWGFVEVLPDRVTILANDAQAPAQIDTARAKEQLEHGHKLWSDAGDDADKYTEAERVIREAEAKLASAGDAKTH